MYVFRHRTGKLVAQQIHAGAAVRFALLTPETFAAGRKADRRAAGACGKARNVFSHFDNIAAEFVAEDGPFMTVHFVPVQIRPAHAAGFDFDDYPVRSADGIRYGFSANVFRAMQYSS